MTVIDKPKPKPKKPLNRVVQVRLHDDVYRVLELAAAEDEISVSEALRDAVLRGLIQTHPDEFDVRGPDEDD